MADLPGDAHLRDMVARDLASIGVRVKNPGSVSVDQLSAIAKVFQETRDQGARLAEVKRIFARG